MSECKNQVYTRWSMKQEILDDLDGYDDVNDDTIREIADSLIPAYNHSLIEFCSHYSGEEFWDLWNDNNGLGGETPLEILRENLWLLYYTIGCEVLQEREENEDE